MDNHYNIEQLRQTAIKKLPRPALDYLEGGSDDELSLANNVDAFAQYHVIPKCLRDIRSRDIRTTFLGKEVSAPFFISPTGFTAMFHPEEDLAGARAAEKFGTFFTLSTFSNTTIEDVAAASNGPKMFQVYALSDRGINREHIQICKDTGYDALCLTVDTVVGGNRERDVRSGFTVPPQPNLRTIYEISKKPSWALGYLSRGGASMVNVPGFPKMTRANKAALLEFMTTLLEPNLTWNLAENMLKEWAGPFVVKGIMSVEDAKRARDIGASAIMISNHGGRQMDGTPAPIQMLRQIREAVGDDLEVVVDGGIRRGSSIIKALAMGASSVGLGRAYLYGLAADGERGVMQALNILKRNLREIWRSVAVTH